MLPKNWLKESLAEGGAENFSEDLAKFSKNLAIEENSQDTEKQDVSCDFSNLAILANTPLFNNPPNRTRSITLRIFSQDLANFSQNLASEETAQHNENKEFSGKFSHLANLASTTISDKVYF